MLQYLHSIVFVLFKVNDERYLDQLTLVWTYFLCPKNEERPPPSLHKWSRVHFCAATILLQLPHKHNRRIWDENTFYFFSPHFSSHHLWMTWPFRAIDFSMSLLFTLTRYCTALPWLLQRNINTMGLKNIHLQGRLLLRRYGSYYLHFLDLWYGLYNSVEISYKSFYYLATDP